MAATAPPVITALPAPPDPNDRSTFNTRAYPWSVAQQTLATEANAVASNVYANASEAASSANSAAISVLDAIAQVTLANAAASSAEATAGATQWASGAAYAIGDCVWSPLNQQTYRRKVAGAGTTDPSADNTNWTQVGGGSSKILRSTRTSNAQLMTADNGKLIDITSGPFTQTFAAAATLGEGWFCYLRNSGTGDITLDPNGAELIDGVVSGVVKPGMVLLVQCDGVAFTVLRIDSHTITEVKTSGTSWTCPLGVRRAKLRLVGGGSSGIYTGNTTYCTGAGGGYLEKTLSLTPGTTYSYSVGVGGAATTSASPFVNAGGNTTFTANAVSYTGNGGNPSQQYSQSPGGTAVNGDINITGGASMILSSNSDATIGGSTPLGQGGMKQMQGTGYGSGGGAGNGSGSPTTGAGAPGVVILEY